MISLEKVTPEKDPVLWEMAHKRAGFKKHLITYITVNIFLWALWFFSDKDYFGDSLNTYPWPVWPTFGWGIGLVLNFANTYGLSKIISTEDEYKKLKNKQTAIKY